MPLAYRSGLLLGLTLATAACLPRPDDRLEPNDSRGEAVTLQPGVAVEARANQGDPDVFKVAAGRGRTLNFELQSLGLEDCPAFRLEGPGGRVLYADGRARCRRMGKPAVQQPQVTFEIVAGFGYRLRALTPAAGDYYFTVIEGSDADNIFSYSWDYRLTVSIE